MSGRKTRMISCRISEQEYRKFRELLPSQAFGRSVIYGVWTFSDLILFALKQTYDIKQTHELKAKEDGNANGQDHIPAKRVESKKATKERKTKQKDKVHSRLKAYAKKVTK